MLESPEAFRYISYLRLRWRFVAVGFLSAVVLAAGISFLLPAKYTATARVVIEPAAIDPRSSMAVSPIYLESLKTYEHFAASDSLFQKAVVRFGLRDLVGSRPVESLKKSILKVGTVRSTRILEISATLPDARRAQALAQFIAEQAVAMNHSLIMTSGDELIRSVERQEEEARAQLREVDASWAHLLSAEPIQDLQAQVEREGELRVTLERQLAAANIDLAESTSNPDGSGQSSKGTLQPDAENARARVAELRRQLESLDRQNAEREKLLATRLADRERLAAQRTSAQTALTSLETRLRDTRTEQDYRGERLSIIDPGVVPEKPSSPNIPLNLAAAVFLGILLPSVYLAFEMSFREQSVLHALVRDE